jgi:hypothetical protein
MHAVRTVFEQLRTDGGPLLAAAVWAAGPSIGMLLVLSPIILVRLLRRAIGDGAAIVRLHVAPSSNR